MDCKAPIHIDNDAMFGFGRRKRIYMDFAGATPVLPRAQEAADAAAALFGNPGAIHSEGARAKASLAASRASIASVLGVKPREIVFVSGGTEANNLAILGFFRALEKKGTHIADTHWLVSAIEHPSVLACFDIIEKAGARVERIAPDSDGRIRPDAVAALLKQDTVFVSIGWANHEIGTLQPIAEIAQLLRSQSSRTAPIVFHCDAGQGPLYLRALVHGLGPDLMTFDSGKLYGPRGIGALVIRPGSEEWLAPLIVGGGQEYGLRGGTENVALAAGFAAALQIVAHERQREAKRLRVLSEAFAARIQAVAPGAVRNGEPGLPHILNVSIPGIESEYVVLAMDHRGVALSTKSACREGEEKLSHVVAALERAAADAEPPAPWRASHTLRISLGRDTRMGDVQRAVDTLEEVLRLPGSRIH